MNIKINSRVNGGCKMRFGEYLNELTTPQKHQLKIAKDTLKMSDAGAKVMGGMTKNDAKKFLKSIGWSDKKISSYEE